MQSPQQAVEESPDVAELETMVWPYWREVSLLLAKEMKGSGDIWQKVYVGRVLVAILDRAEVAELGWEEKLLIRAFASGPEMIWSLPTPNTVVRQLEQEKPGTDKANKQDAAALSEEQLQVLRQAKVEALRRNAEDEQIMWTNRGVDVFYHNFSRLLVKTGRPAGYQAVLGRLGRQLAGRDAAFQTTLEVLETVSSAELDPRQQKLLLEKLAVLRRRFGGKRQYTVYTEVQKNEKAQSTFGQQELDFSLSSQVLMERLQGRDVVPEGVEPLERPAEDLRPGQDESDSAEPMKLPVTTGMEQP